MNQNEMRAAMLNAIRKLHYITAEDYANDTIDICAECGVEYPCTTVDILNGKVS